MATSGELRLSRKTVRLLCANVDVEGCVAVEHEPVSLPFEEAAQGIFRRVIRAPDVGRVGRGGRGGRGGLRAASKPMFLGFDPTARPRAEAALSPEPRPCPKTSRGGVGYRAPWKNASFRAIRIATICRSTAPMVASRYARACLVPARSTSVCMHGISKTGAKRSERRAISPRQ